MNNYPEYTVFEFFLKKVGNENYRELAEKYIKKLSWYFSEINGFHQNQIKDVKLQIIDLMLQDCHLPRTFANRSECNQQIFVNYEQSISSSQFDDWLERRIEHDKDVTQEVYNDMALKVREILHEVIVVGNNYGYYYGLEDFQDIAKRLHLYAQECTEWRNQR